MPSLRDYESLAPFSIEELVDAVNSLTRDSPRLKVSLRTIRFYISRDLLPRPLGAPKVARYGMEHLLRTVAYRCMQESGRSLEESKREMDLVIRNIPEAIEHVEMLLHRPVLSVIESSVHRSLSLQPRVARLPVQETVTKIRLTPSAVLEHSGESGDIEDLKEALAALEAHIENLENIT